MRAWSRVLLLFVFASAAARAGELEERFAARPGGKLHIEVPSGLVEVRTHDRDEIHIEAFARGVGAGGVRFHASAEGDDVRLAAETEPWLDLMRNPPGVRVRVHVPPAYAVVLGEGVELARTPVDVAFDRLGAGAAPLP